MVLSEEQKTTYRIEQVVSARVEQVFPFGVFVRLEDGTEAYVRQRELTQSGDMDPQEVFSEGENITAKVIGLPGADRKLELSVRRAQPDPWDQFYRDHKVRDPVKGRVKSLTSGNAFVEIIPGVDGVIPLEELAPWELKQPAELLWLEDQVEAMITHLNPQKRLPRLSIRRQMLHMARVHRIRGRLRAQDKLEGETEWLDEAGESADEQEPQPIDFYALDRALVLDDHDGVRQELVVWLERNGCPADGFGQLQEALDAVGSRSYDLYFVDLDLSGDDGLDFVRTMQKRDPDAQIVVMSIPEWIADRLQELGQLGVSGVLTKPLDMDEVRFTLARLAQGEQIGLPASSASERTRSAADPFQQLSQKMRSGISLGERLEAGMAELTRLTKAELGLLFRLDPDSQQIRLLVRAGKLALDEEKVYALSASPVGDLILRGGEVFEAGLSGRARRRFQKLLNAVQFEACMGVPVPAEGRVEHALFLFHRQPDAFTHYRLRDARAMAMVLGVALESEALEARILEDSPFLLSGQLATGFGHDVYNKMSALELQVRNLKAPIEAMTGQAGEGATECAAPQELALDVQRLLQTSLDLKETAGAFRALMRADNQAEMDVNAVVLQAHRLLIDIARRDRFRIHLNLAPELPLTRGSSVRLQQVFLNVMLNAIQQLALKEEKWPQAWKGLEVSTGLQKEPEPTIWVRFDDTGPGIHRQLWDSVFDLGFSTRPGGTGLGLFIARSLMESMGGEIEVEHSMIPTGTAFRVTIPVNSTRTARGEG